MQTSFDQEEQILKGLKYSKKSSEEQEQLYWHIINNKRMFGSLLEIMPYYFAWIMAVILLVNVSSCDLISVWARTRTLFVLIRVKFNPTHARVFPFNNRDRTEGPSLRQRVPLSAPSSSSPRFTTVTRDSTH